MDIFSYLFFRNALLATLFISVAAAVTGTYVMTRRQLSLAGGITHSSFGGLGLGYFLGINPLWTALAFAVAAAFGVETMSRRGNMRADSAIAVVWAVGMALGVLFVFLTPGYVPELTAFLFGNILTVSSLDLWLEGGFALLSVAAFMLWRRSLIAFAFDPDFASVRGLPVRSIGAAMNIFVAMGIVLTIRLVGVMLLMSMLTLPVLAAERLSRSYGRITLLSACIGAATGVGALLLSALVNVPCSAFLVIIQALLYVAVRLLTRRA